MGSITEPKSHGTLEFKLSKALQDAQHRYSVDHHISKRNHEEACKYMPGGNTRTVLHISPFPLTIESGESCYLRTADGKEYIDFLGEYSAGIYGHSNPVIKAAIEETLRKGWNYGGITQVEQKLARVICERFPAIELVRFVNSGTEANMMALATAVAFTGRKTVLMFRGAYHGGTISSFVHPEKANINLPHKFVIGEYNDIQGTLDHASSLKDDLAAIIIEPMMGSGGCFAATPQFLQLLRDLAARYGAVLIFDEVMTSRLSYHGLGHAYGIKPDLMTIGKWIGGGMTFGAFGGRKNLMEMYDPRTNQLQHPGTFNNNVFTMTAGIAGCGILDEVRVRELNDLARCMTTALREILQKHGIGGITPEAPLLDDQHIPRDPTRPPKMFVCGVGSLMTVHFGGPHRLALQGLYYHHMLDHGIYVAQRGFIALNIELTQNHIDRFVEATDAFCQTWQAALR